MNINNINVLCEEEIHDKMQKSVSFQKNNFLFKHQLASGEIRDVDVYSGKIVLGGEKLLYSIIHDVTDRMILQDKLKESNEDLERFAYVSSHDLQEPLRMVTSFTQLLERRYKGRLDEDADDYIGFIVDGAKRMKLLIDDLLMFSRLNTQPKENELVNLETVLDTVLLNLQVSIVENNVEITHDPLPSIYGDLSRKVQVFQNLISNAIKFNDKKIIKIHISAKKEGNERIFSVSDNGIGMDPKHLERIFIIFQRLHTREEYEGTGIGLAIIQKIIQQQNGRIWVESELGKGSTFYFTIPIN
jgi:light-regulated signal transduction histidine kinase (bacteriophytochrome)